MLKSIITMLSSIQEQSTGICHFTLNVLSSYYLHVLSCIPSFSLYAGYAVSMREEGTNSGDRGHASSPKVCFVQWRLCLMFSMLLSKTPIRIELMNLLMMCVMQEEAREELGMKLYPTGSTLPDCSHACGPCFPCKRVMISYKCSVESCPIVYRCMCKGKYYHVPASN